MTLSFRIPSQHLRKLQLRVQKAARRSARWGLPRPELRVVSQWGETFEVYDALAQIRGASSNYRKVAMGMTEVELTGVEPAVGEWQLSGWRWLQRSAGRTVLGNSAGVPDNMRTGKLCCSHCGYDRRRKQTIIFTHKDGRSAEVGTNCAGAFTGNASAGLLEGLAEIGGLVSALAAASQFDRFDGTFDFDEEVRTVLAVANRNVRDFGFISSMKAQSAPELVPTWRDVADELVRYRQDSDDGSITVTAADFFAADDIIAHFKDRADDSDFCSAVNQVISRGLADLRGVAVLTAAADSYIKFLSRVAKADDAKLCAAFSAPVSEPGNRIDLIGRVYSLKTFPGRFGEITYASILDGDGNLFHWKTNSNPEIEVGRAYEMKGTVKEHRICERGAFEGVQETVLQRVAIGADLGPVTFAARNPTLDATDEAALDDMMSSMSL